MKRGATLKHAMVSGALTLSAVMLCADVAFAQAEAPGTGKAQAKGSVYVDDDNTQIVTALADAQVALPSDMSLGAHALVDVISSASVDVVSAASSKKHFEEVRIEFGARAGVFITPEVDLGVAYTRSQENDWLSNSPSANVGWDLFKRNTRLTLGYGFSHNAVGRSGDPSFAQRLHIHTVQAGLNQLIDKKTILSLTYWLQHADGWQSSPYRYVSTRNGLYGFLETHPDQRVRHALAISGLRYLTKGVGLEASYRFYGDDWGVLGHTASAGVRFDFLDHWDARIRARGYYQTAAGFWQESYDQPMQYMSADRELSTFWDAGGGIKLGYHYGAFAVDVKVDGIYYEFVDFAPLASRVAVVSDVGLGVDW